MLAPFFFHAKASGPTRVPSCGSRKCVLVDNIVIVSASSHCSKARRSISVPSSLEYTRQKSSMAEVPVSIEATGDQNQQVRVHDDHSLKLKKCKCWTQGMMQSIVRVFSLPLIHENSKHANVPSHTRLTVRGLASEYDVCTQDDSILMIYKSQSIFLSFHYITDKARWQTMLATVF